MWILRLNNWLSLLCAQISLEQNWMTDRKSCHSLAGARAYTFWIWCTVRMLRTTLFGFSEGVWRRQRFNLCSCRDYKQSTYPRRNWRECRLSLPLYNISVGVSSYDICFEIPWTHPNPPNPWYSGGCVVLYRTSADVGESHCRQTQS